MKRYVGGLVIATFATILLLWAVPPVGLIAAVVMLVLLPPWGRSLAERAMISGVVLAGVVAIVFPRAGALPITRTTVLLLVSLLLIALLALRSVPALRDVSIPRPSLSDVLLLALLLATAGWFMAAYIGQSSVSMVSGLFFTGWDNHGHFTTFANTYVEQSALWPTIDGSTAWNQWYPALQTTLMAMAEQAWSGAYADRTALLWPYVQWNSMLFALSLVGLAWVAGDMAARFGGRSRVGWTRPLATALFALFALLGSPALLYNRGFTNFVMGVALVVVVAWIGARSARSARLLGWFVVPLGLLAVVALWTPLAIGLVPAGLVVAIALWRHRRWLGISWVTVMVVPGGVITTSQLRAVLGANPEAGPRAFAQNLGSIDVGMAEFNVGAALAAPAIVALVAAILLVRRRPGLAVGVAGPVLGVFLIAVAFMIAADASGTNMLESYYVLKPLSGALLAVAPVIAALLAVVTVRGLDGMGRAVRLLGIATTVIVGATVFGYAGALPANGVDGLDAAAGVRAGADRAAAVANSTIGEVLIRSADAARPYPDDTTVLWDSGGILQNLWVASLHTTLSKDMQTMYLSLPSDPYDDLTLAYLDLMMSTKPGTSFAVLWFAPDSRIPLMAWASGKDRVTLVQVPMPANGACPECTG